jgi:hypothetical protein
LWLPNRQEAFLVQTHAPVLYQLNDVELGAAAARQGVHLHAREGARDVLIATGPAEKARKKAAVATATLLPIGGTGDFAHQAKRGAVRRSVSKWAQALAATHRSWMQGTQHLMASAKPHLEQPTPMILFLPTMVPRGYYPRW